MPFEISDFSISTLQDNKYVKPVQLCYIQNGRTRVWEAVKCHDGVSVLLYHTDRKAFLLVKQFRAPVHMNHPQYTYTHELCAGIVDKSVSLGQIAREEVLEECGFNLPPDRPCKISSFFTNVGISGNQQHLFYASIDDSMKVNEGGGIHNEQILLTYVPLAEAKQFLFDESLAKTPSLMFAFYWFFKEFGENAERLPANQKSCPPGTKDPVSNNENESSARLK